MRRQKINIAFVLFLCLTLVNSSVVAQSPSALGQNFGTAIRAQHGDNLNSFNTTSSIKRDLSNEQSIGGNPGIVNSATGVLQSFYSVHILGNVKFPGNYKILPSDKLTDALKYAGGVLPTGSSRKIELRRDSQSTLHDLYLYEYKGILSQNPFLMENDVIYVPTKRGEFQIEGPVNRPGKYEITKDIALAEAIEMAGGFSAGLSQKDPIRVIRFNQDEKKEILQIETTAPLFKHFIVNKSDIIVVPHILLTNKEFDYDPNRLPGDNIFYPTRDDNVYVIGAVAQPGPYPFQTNWTFKEYVSMAGPTDKINLMKVEIFTRDGKRKKLSYTTVINPGDTLIVPRRRFTPESIIGIASSIIGITLSTIVLTEKL